MLLYNIAEREARRIPQKTYHIVAIAMERNKILAMTSNLPCRECTPEAHAEARLARRVNLRNKTVYVLRFRKDGMALAKPCANCMTILKNARVSKVYYSTEEGMESL